MDQNQTVDNDLQKAIDDITNTTNIDPVFSDPVAAPSSVPEGDTGELGAPIGPFPEEPKVQMIPPAPEPIAPLQSVDIPELNSLPPIGQTPTPEAEEILPPAPLASQPAPQAIDSLDITPSPKLSTGEIKKAALRDLVPLLDHLNMDSEQKFNIYRDIFNDLRDYTILEPAYKAAREIPDETKRAEALLYLIESIDKM